MKWFSFLSSLLLIALGCAKQPSSSTPLIVATTGMLADAARALVEPEFEVRQLMGPGVDPHLYKATQKDISAFSQADLIIFNGLFLEGKLAEILEKMEGKSYAAASAIPDSLLMTPPEYEGNFDPHVWHNVFLWQIVVRGMADRLSSRFPQLSDSIATRSQRYIADLNRVDTWIFQEVNKISPKKRVLITAHDAFAYFGRRYGLEVNALQGISTVAEFGLKDVSNLVNLVIERDIRAIFSETSVSDRSVNAIIEGAQSRGHQLMLGGSLFSDAMGEAGTEKGTYPGMIRHNVQTIVEALQ